MKHRYGLGAAKILHRAAIAVWKFRAAGRKLDGKSVSLEFLNTLATERTAGDSSSARLFSESFEYVYKIFSDLLKRVVYKAFLRRNLWKSKIAAR